MCIAVSVKTILADPDSPDDPPCLRAYTHRQGFEKEISSALRNVDFTLHSFMAAFSQEQATIPWPVFAQRTPRIRGSTHGRRVQAHSHRPQARKRTLHSRFALISAGYRLGAGGLRIDKTAWL